MKLTFKLSNNSVKYRNKLIFKLLQIATGKT